MNESVIPYLSKRLRIKSITSKYPFWLQFKYRQDDYYRYALNRFPDQHAECVKNTFRFVCHHRETGRFVGYANGYIAGNVHSAWIQSFLIDKQFLRMGFGTEFFNGILQILKKDESHPIDRIYLTCYENNLSGVSFWNKLTFQKVRETVKHGTSDEIIGIYERIL